MDLKERLDAFYREAVRLKSEGLLAESEHVEAQAAQFLEGLKAYAEERPEDPQTATNLLFLAEREWPFLGDHARVQEKIERALAIRQARFGPDDLAVAEALCQLAEFHYLAGRLGEAEPLYRRAVVISERQGSPPSAAGAKCQAGLAQCLAAFGRASEADPFFRKAIELTSRPEGDKHVLYFLCLSRAEGLEKLGRKDEAQALRQEANLLLPSANPGEQGFHV